MEVTILSATERKVFKDVGDIRTVVTIRYRTDTGYEGEIELEKPLPDREGILEAIRKDIEALSGLIGQTVKL